jgi:hypothetical protein
LPPAISPLFTDITFEHCFAAPTRVLHHAKAACQWGSGGGVIVATERSKLRLSDLKTRTPTGSRLMNVKLPIEIITAIDRLAKQLSASKTSVIVALLNEGLAMAQKKR